MAAAAKLSSPTIRPDFEKLLFHMWQSHRRLMKSHNIEFGGISDSEYRRMVSELPYDQLTLEIAKFALVLLGGLY